MIRFRVANSPTGVVIQERQQTLFGVRWCSLWHFSCECKGDCKTIVELLNRCNETSQDNDKR